MAATLLPQSPRAARKALAASSLVKPLLPLNREQRRAAAKRERALPRRVYRRELREALGFSATWFRKLQKDGTIPKGNRDRVNGREWFPEDVARAVLAKLAA